jgi:hypothetical protein
MQRSIHRIRTKRFFRRLDVPMEAPGLRNERDDVGSGHETSPSEVMLTIRGQGCLELDQKDLRPKLYRFIRA